MVDDPMTRMYIKAEASGERVFDALLDHPLGLTTKQIQTETSLTSRQVEHGISYVRRILATAQAEPIVYDPVSRRYSLAMRERDSIAYVVFRLKIARVQMERLKTATVIPSEQKFGPALAVRRLAVDMGRVEEDLEFLLANQAGA
jgi:hypothetical protein